jgi:(p)ppGpp synthase/HD superfamily hydrolase
MSKPVPARFGPRLTDAMAYAAELHASQLRKGTQIPYLSHLLAVCSLVLEDGGDEDQAIAALLHDGPEDQGGQATLDEIRQHFGDRVATMVHGLSDALPAVGEEREPWRPRKEKYLRRLETEEEPVLRISLADKLHNLRTIVTDLEIGQEVWTRFTAGPAEQAWYFRALLDIFERRIPQSRNLSEFRRLVQRLEA